MYKYVFLRTEIFLSVEKQEEVRGKCARAPQKASMRPENSLYSCYTLSTSELQKPRKLLSLNPVKWFLKLLKNTTLWYFYFESTY
jgi:hypothetical protein